MNEDIYKGPIQKMILEALRQALNETKMSAEKKMDIMESFVGRLKALAEVEARKGGEL